MRIDGWYLSIHKIIYFEYICVLHLHTQKRERCTKLVTMLIVKERSISIKTYQVTCYVTSQHNNAHVFITGLMITTYICVNYEVYNEVQHEVQYEVHDEVYNEMYNEVPNEVCNQMYNEVHNEVTMRCTMRRAVRCTMRSIMRCIMRCRMR